MSLILDALTRSEKERQEQSGAISLDPYAITPRHTATGKVVMWVALALIANAAVLYVLFSGSEAEVQPVNTAEYVRQPGIANKIESRLEAGQPGVVLPAVNAAPVIPVQTASLSPPARPLSDELGERPKPVVSGKKTEPAVQQSAAVVPSTAASIVPATEISPPTDQGPSSGKPVPTLSSSPESVQAKLRRYEINAVVYSSTPSRRWALINMKRHREGDTLSGTDYQVEEITPTGVVVDYGSGRTVLSVSR